MVSPGETQVIEVTPKTQSKLLYLRRIMDGVHSIQDDFRTYRTEILAADQMMLDRRINWNGISNFLAPEVVLMTATTDKERDKPLSGVWEYPIYAITEGGTIDLKRPWTLSVTVSRQRAKSDAIAALNSLRDTISTFDERKRSSAMIHFTKLEKIMVPKS